MNSCNVLLVSPQFPVATFWNNKAMCKVRGRAIPLSPSVSDGRGLAAVRVDCRLVDRNVADSPRPTSTGPTW